MDAFETVVASILQRQGYWTLTSVKVELTKAEKVKIGRHSSPRWELDIVAYRGKGNEVREKQKGSDPLSTPHQPKHC